MQYETAVGLNRAAEVDRRQTLAENQAKWVKVVFGRSPSVIRLRIEDQGQGFAWENFLKPDPARLFDSHGRGILLAKWEAFDRVFYQGLGNRVVAEIDL